MPTKALTLRLPVELYDQLQIVAEVQKRPIANVVRSAIAAYVMGRTTDVDYRDRAMKRILREDEP